MTFSKPMHKKLSIVHAHKPIHCLEYNLTIFIKKPLIRCEVGSWKPDDFRMQPGDI